MKSFFLATLLLASLAFADQSLVGTWEHESGQSTLTIRDDGTITLVTSIDAGEILIPTELGFRDNPDVEETLADLIEGRSFQVSLAGTWRVRGSRLLTVYQTADVSGWRELVDDIMEVAGPAIEARHEGSTEEKRDFAVSGYRGLLASLFSVDDTFLLGEETFASWSIQDGLLTLGGKVYKMVVPTSVKSVSWGELKRR